MLRVEILRLHHKFASLRHGSAKDRNFGEESVEERDQKQEECDFVELRWVARDAVAEVDGPREIRGSAVGVVGEAGEEAANASDGDAESERDGVQIAGGGAEPNEALHEFDSDEAGDEGSDDGFASDEVVGVVEVLKREAWVFEPEKKFGTESSAGDGGSDDGPPKRSDDGISEAAAELQVRGEGNDVRERFEE